MDKNNTLIIVFQLCLIISLVNSQCNKCKLYLSQPDCESQIAQISQQCKWKTNICVQKVCKDFVTFPTCNRQSDDGVKCYWDDKRGCNTLQKGCTSLQNCSATQKYCKPTYNGAWCIDEIAYSEPYCYEKQNVLACVGQDENDETSVCQWDYNYNYCEAISRSSSCSAFKNTQQCSKMWGCIFYNNICTTSSCYYFEQNQCTTYARQKQYQYSPCQWNSTQQYCIPVKAKTLTNLTCQLQTQGTYTWNVVKNVCSICQGKEALSKYIGAAIVIIIIGLVF